MKAMFSVAIAREPDGEPKWTAVCDRCGQELDVIDAPLTMLSKSGILTMRLLAHANRCQVTT